MRPLVRIFNHWAYPVFAAILLASIAFALGGNGITTLDIIVIAILVIVLFVVWRLLVSTQTEQIDSIAAVKQTIEGGSRPTVVEFYSRYCVGCMAMKPIVDRLESEAGDRLQIVRLNIDEEPGKTLMDDYDVVFTPTFLYFDADGNKISESIGVLDRARILYELEGV